MEDLIRSQVQCYDPDEVEELNLNGFHGSNFSVKDKNCIEEYRNLEFLTISNVGIKVLENFPILPKLIKLDLSENRIESGLQHLV
jgi:Leucine-rich repeat (LRR) protein